MTAVDTNVLVRVLAGDDARQDLTARTLFASGPVWIAKTVLLETAWVLESTYGFTQPAIQAAFVKLAGLKSIQLEDSSAVAEALDLFQHGLDFADAMHLCSRPAGAWFATFDRKLVQRAQRAGVPAVTPVR